jgi:carbonic anhydrase
MTWDEALLRLQAGNDRFVHGESLHPYPDSAARRRLRLAQHPIAAVLGCSDSQVPPELVFDQGLGSLFVVRMPGNVAAPIALAALQYARCELKVELVVVLGHQGCHAVQVALEAQQAAVPPPECLEPIVRLIQPALGQGALGSRAEAALEAAVEAHVRWVVRQISEAAAATRSPGQRPTHIVGAVCQAATGLVRFLD